MEYDQDKMYQVPHYIEDHSDERSSTSFQINCINSRMQTVFHKMAKAHVAWTFIGPGSAEIMYTWLLYSLGQQFELDG